MLLKRTNKSHQRQPVSGLKLPWCNHIVHTGTLIIVSCFTLFSSHPFSNVHWRTFLFSFHKSTLVDVNCHFDPVLVKNRFFFQGYFWAVKLKLISINNATSVLLYVLLRSCLYMLHCWALYRSRYTLLIKFPPCNLINYPIYLTRQNPAQKILLGCNILALNVLLGNGSWLSQSWSSSNTQGPISSYQIN